MNRMEVERRMRPEVPRMASIQGFLVSLACLSLWGDGVDGNVGDDDARKML